MALEIEKKYRINKKMLVELTARLAELGAEFAYETFEENYLHRGGHLAERDAFLRLRKTDTKNTLTYKEKVANDSDFKHQIEFETVVSDVDATERIIEKLGYDLAIVYEKRRKAWHFGKVEVVLDELPFGYYMEIEGSMKEIQKAEKQLGAEGLEVEARGYPRLTLRNGKVNRNGVTQARFAKGKRANQA
jgi:adenylate cyclase class 2